MEGQRSGKQLNLNVVVMLSVETTGWRYSCLCSQGATKYVHFFCGNCNKTLKQLRIRDLGVKYYMFGVALWNHPAHSPDWRNNRRERTF
jgi:hypothetical protein